MSKKDAVIEHIKAAISSGQYQPLSPLPPTRELARQFGLARDTVVRAYQKLREEEFIESTSTRDFYVREKIPSPSSKAANNLIPIDMGRLSTYAKRLVSEPVRFPISSDFVVRNFGGPPPSLLPSKKWQETMRVSLKESRMTQYAPEILGRSELKSALAAFLHRTKGISCSGEEIVVFSSTFTAVNLLCRLLLNPGDCIAVEDPGFGGIRNIAAAIGLNVQGIPLDSQGLVVDQLSRLAVTPKLVYVTPTHQEPTGVTYSQERRQDLFDWARRHQAWIVEDDYDGYFQYGKTRNRPIRTLDIAGSNVFYLSTFWRLLYPLTSIGFCTIPTGLLDLLCKSKIEVEGVSETIFQLTLAQLLNDGFIDKYCRRLTDVYNSRRISCVQSCTRLLPTARITAGTSGTDLTISIDAAEGMVLAAAREVNLPLNSINPYYLTDRSTNTYTLDFACLTPGDMLRRLSDFAKILGSEPN